MRKKYVAPQSAQVTLPETEPLMASLSRTQPQVQPNQEEEEELDFN